MAIGVGSMDPLGVVPGLREPTNETAGRAAEVYDVIVADDGRHDGKGLAVGADRRHQAIGATAIRLELALHWCVIGTRCLAREQ